MRFITSFLLLGLFCNFMYSDVSNNCSTKMVQVMKPLHPNTGYQGFAVVQFNIDKEGNPKKIRAISSECATGRDKKGKIVLKKCPFFKSNAVSAAKYIKYEPPVDGSGNSCEVKNKTFEYKFSLYNVELEYDDFFIREDFKSDRFTSDEGDVRMFSPRGLNQIQDPPDLTQKASATSNVKP